MAYDDALAAVSAKYEPAIDPAETPHLAELKRRGAPGHLSDGRMTEFQ
jgi:hypothetical protein